MNRYAPPASEVSDPHPAPSIAGPEQLARANKVLKRARLAFVIFFVSYFLIGYTARNHPALLPLAQLALPLSFVTAHVFLGQSARRAGRSVVLYALLPLLLPVLGGLISFGVLWSKVERHDA